MKLTRDVVGYPALQIDAEGFVWNSGRRMPTTNVQDPHGISMIAILYEDELLPIWDLMASAWYKGGLILPRDGNFFSCRKSSIVHLEYVSSDVIKDADDIRWIWWMYCRGFRCAEILEESKWSGKYKVDDVKNVVRDVLVQGIR